MTCVHGVKPSPALPIALSVWVLVGHLGGPCHRPSSRQPRKGVLFGGLGEGMDLREAASPSQRSAEWDPESGWRWSKYPAAWEDPWETHPTPQVHPPGGSSKGPTYTLRGRGGGLWAGQ